MKGKRILISVLALGLMLALAVGLTQAQEPGPQGEVGVKAAPVGATALAPLSTSFTYQGRLTDGGGPANGSYDFQFKLYDAASGGGWVGTIPKDDVTVSDGLFMVELDFGSGFTGDARWLEIGVRPGASAGAYTTLTPRQALTATPYALYALGAPWSGLTGVPPDFADGVDADTLGGLSCGNGQVAKWNNTTSQWQCGNDETSAGGGGWSLTGNAGTNPATNFLGTTDDQALELRVNNVRALRLEPNADSPNLIGGYSGNSVTSGVVGATIGGGGDSIFPNRVTDNYSTVGGGVGNYAGNSNGSLNDAANATVGGGWDNVASDYAATIGGGSNNQAYSDRSTIGGGDSNYADAAKATIGGGEYIRVTGRAATVAGGSHITVTNQYAAVGGGQHNIASGDYATVGGGGYNTASGFGAVIAGGGGFDPFWSSIDGNTASGKSSTVGGGINNTASGSWATIGGGQVNTVSNQSATVGGGSGNVASGAYATVGGGEGNIASGDDSTIGGGDKNEASGEEATVGGGRANEASGGDATVAGGELNIASGNHASVGGGFWNAASGDLVTIGGGEYISVTGQAATVAGGSHITVTNDYAAVGGGLHNAASGLVATIGGGSTNTASGEMAFLGGGQVNTASGYAAVVGGGGGNLLHGTFAMPIWVGNTADGDWSTVGGGYDNTATGEGATIPGGVGNTAQGDHSFAAGHRAQANHNGAFVWADSTDADFTSTAADQFAVRANGGALITGASSEPMLTVTNLGGGDGLRVNKGGDDGLQIGDGTDFPNYGVYIPSDGVAFTALYVQTADANGEWALSTLDKISAANVTFSSLTLVAVVDGPDPLAPGDLVAVAGLADPLPDTLSPLPRVRLADAKAWPGVIGVVEGRMALQPLPGKADKDGDAPLELHSVPGPAKAGDYVALTVLGVAHVKADATAGDIVAGQRLTAAGRSGHVRALRTRMLEGMVVTEGAPVIGIALAPLDKDSGTIPVFVTLR